MLPEAQSRGWPPSNWVYLAHGSLPRRQYAPTVLDFAAEVAVFGPIEWENHHSETYSQLHRINKNIPPTPSKQKKTLSFGIKYRQSLFLCSSSHNLILLKCYWLKHSSNLSPRLSITLNEFIDVFWFRVKILARIKFLREFFFLSAACL